MNSYANHPNSPPNWNKIAIGAPQRVPFWPVQQSARDSMVRKLKVKLELLSGELAHQRQSELTLNKMCKIRKIADSQADCSAYTGLILSTRKNIYRLQSDHERISQELEELE